MPGCHEPAVGDISARPGTFLCGGGRSTPSGTGILSPNAQDAPVRKDTHPAARNVPVGPPLWAGDAPPYRATSGVDA